MSIDEITATAPDLESPEHDLPPAERVPWRSRLTLWDMRYSPYFFISPFFILFAIFGLFPLGYTFWVSLHDWSLLGPHSWIGPDNYTALFSDPYFWNALVNTLGIFVVATIPQLLLALMIAQLLNRRIRGRTFWRMGVLLPNVTSVAAVGIIFTLIFARDFGLANWLLGQVGIDQLAGPSEIYIVADETGDAEMIATDLLAQAEHDVRTRVGLITTDLKLAKAALEAVERQLATLPTADVAGVAWRDYGEITVCADEAAMIEYSDHIAAEHLEAHLRVPDVEAEEDAHELLVQPARDAA